MPRTTGTYERTAAAGEKVEAFIPYPLPPTSPTLVLDEQSTELLKRAEHKLALLELAGEMVPSFNWFLYAFVRKEAVVSSQIEGTQATLIDLLTFEAEGNAESARPADVREVINYLDALEYARAETKRANGVPLSMRLLNESHRLLLRGAPGKDRQPGQVRRTQNWVGGTRPSDAAFVPPPPHVLGDLLSSFERYIHADDALPALVRTGLLHVQFETIHPYLDGNGRIGRLLVALLLEHWKLLSRPLLYLSLFFKRNRPEYYALLNRVRTDGDWEAWIRFFLQGVDVIADEATRSARDLFTLVTSDRARLLAAPSGTLTAARLFEQLPENPVVTVARVTKLLSTSKPTATKAVTALVDGGILVETTGRKRDRTFHYRAYLEQLRVGTDLEDQ